MILTSRSTLPEAVLAVCKLWAEERSKDPSTKVGACVYDPRTGGLFLGYNGFPAGVSDDEDTWKFRGQGMEALIRAESKLTKYDLVIHAEVNAVRKALMGGVDMTKAVLYCTHVPCPECMKNVVLANGVKQVVYSEENYRSRVPRDGFVINELARMGGVKVQHLKNYFDTRNEALEKWTPEIEVRTWVCKSPLCTGDNCPYHAIGKKLPQCHVQGCNSEASCFGRYEQMERGEFTCDEHCGHGNEDGQCIPVAVQCCAENALRMECERPKGHTGPHQVFGDSEPVEWTSKEK